MSENREEYFLFDRAGFMDSHGRLTHMPSGDTLVSQRYMTQEMWDRKCLAYYNKHPESLVVQDEAGIVRYKVEDARKEIKEKYIIDESSPLYGCTKNELLKLVEQFEDQPIEFIDYKISGCKVEIQVTEKQVREEIKKRNKLQVM